MLAQRKKESGLYTNKWIWYKMYQQTEKEAIERLKVPRRYDFELRLKYWNDPDYPFDWTEGDFC